METGTMTRVIGWYHSHPHITVLPSHVGEVFNDSKCAWGNNLGCVGSFDLPYVKLQH